MSKEFKPFVPPDKVMSEFTLRALILGLVMTVVLGAANAYLGLKAGMTIAATYPAAVIGMALLRLMKGSILEENIARTIGSIGESIAAGAIFTIPAFWIANVWKGSFFTLRHYLEATAIMFVGSVIGIMFVTILRRVMVEDKELPFPESVAAAEIHRAGRAGTGSAKFLFSAMGLGALIQFLKEFSVFASKGEAFLSFSKQSLAVGEGAATQTGPILLYFVGPEIMTQLKAASPGLPADQLWIETAKNVWGDIVRKIAIGGMLFSAGYTLYKMRNSLATGLSRAIRDVKQAAGESTEATTEARTEKDLPFKWVFLGIGLSSIATFIIYYYFSEDIIAALTATLVMIIAGFFFAAVSGYLVGLIGSSNNPISGLTLSTLIVAAILMVALGVKGLPGIAAVLGVAAVIAVSAAVAGEMLQDLKVGHILGGTPWKMQAGDLIGVFLGSLVMFIPLFILHEGDIRQGGTGLGGEQYPAPQASLMAILAKGIVSGDMAWPLIFIGFVMAIVFILVKVKSPMLVCVGMYLPLETTFAIFIGGLIRGLADKLAARKKFNNTQKTRVENIGILLSAGLIAGEALIGLLFAFFAVMEWKIPSIFVQEKTMTEFIPALLVFVFIGWVLVHIPLRNAGSPEEPAQPTAN